MSWVKVMAMSEVKVMTLSKVKPKGNSQLALMLLLANLANTK